MRIVAAVACCVGLSLAVLLAQHSEVYAGSIVPKKVGYKSTVDLYHTSAWLTMRSNAWGSQSQSPAVVSALRFLRCACASMVWKPVEKESPQAWVAS